MIWEKIKNRYFILSFLVFLISVIFVFRLIYLQIVCGEEYRELSEKKLLNSVPIKAPRGKILDRYGRPLVSNRTGFSVQIHKTDISSQELNAMIYRLIQLFEKEGISYIDSLPISPPPFTFIFEETADSSKEQQEIKWKESEKINANVTAEEAIEWLRQKYQIEQTYTPDVVRKIAGIRYEMEKRSFGRNTPFTFATDVSANIVAQLEERHFDFPGVNVVTEPIREYVHGELAAHILGRVGIIYKEEYETLKDKGYGMNDILGKDGIEKVYEKYLRGKDGVSSIEQNIQGKISQVLTSEPPVPGNDVLLTIDAEIQAVAEKSLADTIKNIQEAGKRDARKNGADANSGAVVVMDIHTGGILAMASYPTYNPARFNEDYAKMYQDPLKPMFNRAISGTYAPGSTFKMLTAIAALEEGIITPNDKIRDEGVYRYYAPSYQPVCWIWSDYGRTHGLINVADALKHSCNYFFYDVGRRLTIDRLEKYGKLFGLGEPTGIELTGESAGIFANPESKKKLRNEPWYPGDTLQASIGQSFNMFTPIQLASYVGTIANGGTRYQAHLLKGVRTGKEGKIVHEYQPQVVNEIKLKPENWKIVMEGMRSVTEDGTASSVFKNFPIAVGGKTGTAQVPRGSANAVFVAFAPYDNPQVAIAVVVEHGAHGNSIAPVARDIIAAYMGLDKPIDTEEPVNSLVR